MLRADPQRHPRPVPEPPPARAATRWPASTSPRSCRCATCSGGAPRTSCTGSPCAGGPSSTSTSTACRSSAAPYRRRSTLVERRSAFLATFHQVLYQAHRSSRRLDDLTVKRRRVPALPTRCGTATWCSSQGTQNQYGEMAVAARAEFLVMQQLLAEPQMREFLGGRPMTPYPEPWMDRVDSMKTIQGWDDTSIMHFNDLATIGEQLVLTIRLGNWAAAGRRRDRGADLGATRSDRQSSGTPRPTAPRPASTWPREPNAEMPSALIARHGSPAPEPCAERRLHVRAVPRAPAVRASAAPRPVRPAGGRHREPDAPAGRRSWPGDRVGRGRLLARTSLHGLIDVLEPGRAPDAVLLDEARLPGHRALGRRVPWTSARRGRFATYRHHDPRDAARPAGTAPRRPGHGRGLRLLPAARPAPRPREVARRRGGELVVDDTLAAGVLGAQVRAARVLRARRWGHRRMAGVEPGHVTVASLAKGLSAPLASSAARPSASHGSRHGGPDPRAHAGPADDGRRRRPAHALDDGSLDVRRSRPRPARGPGASDLGGPRLCRWASRSRSWPPRAGGPTPSRCRRALTGAVRGPRDHRALHRSPHPQHLPARRPRGRESPGSSRRCGRPCRGGQHERTVGHRRPRPRRDGRRAARSVGHRGPLPVVPEPGPAGRASAGAVIMAPLTSDYPRANAGIARIIAARPGFLGYLFVNTRTESGRIAERVALAVPAGLLRHQGARPRRRVTRELAEAARRLGPAGALRPRRRHRHGGDGRPRPIPTSPGWCPTCRPSPTTGRRSAPSSTSWSGCPTCSPTPRGCATTTCSRTPCVAPVRARCSSAATARSSTPASSWRRPGRCRSTPPAWRDVLAGNVLRLTAPARRRFRARRRSAWQPGGPCHERGGACAGPRPRRRRSSRAGPRRALPRPPRPPRACLGRAPLEQAARRLPRAGRARRRAARPTACRRRSARAAGQRSAGGAVLRVRRPPGARPRVRAQRGGRRRGRSSSGPGATRRPGRRPGGGARHPRGRGWRREDRAAPAARVRRSRQRRCSSTPGPTTRSARRSAPPPRPASASSGRAAHAAMAPARGRNALDAAVLAYRASPPRASRLRTTSDWSSAVLVRGGTVPNVVPEAAELRVMARGPREVRPGPAARVGRAKRACGCHWRPAARLRGCRTGRSTVEPPHRPLARGVAAARTCASGRVAPSGRRARPRPCRGQHRPRQREPRRPRGPPEARDR